MYDSSMFEQFITDIRVIDLGQTVIIDCCPEAPFHNYETYELRCLGCEKIELNFHKSLRRCIGKNGCIDLLEFSISKQENNKISVYIYGRVVSLEVLCEEVKVME